MATHEAALALRGITKAFPGVQALSAVDLECRAGEIHAIVGENGSGKSTLMAVAAGALAPDEGSVTIVGTTMEEPDPARARALGLAVAYQDTSLIDQLTVAQNLWLNADPATRPSAAGAGPWAADQLTQFPVLFQAGDLVRLLSPGERQVLETLKAVLIRPKVLILDEPTNALGIVEVEVLQQVIRRVAGDGTAVIYISHRIREVLALANRVTVLRDGQTQGTFSAAGLSEDAVLSLMIGAPVDQEFPSKCPTGGAPVVVKVEEVVGQGFGPVSLTARRGEIVGLAGAEGNGQRELVRALGGLSPRSGRVAFGNAEIRAGSPRRAVDAGVITVSGDRLAESLFAALGVRPNMTVQVLDDFARGGVITKSREVSAVNDKVDSIGIAIATIEQPVGSLSGGNQQKVVMAGRALMGRAKVLMIDEPTQGIDAKTRLDIYRMLRSLAKEGVTIIVTSSDALELAGLCDTVLVMSRGQVARELSGEHLTESAIINSFVTAEALTTRKTAKKPGRARRNRRSGSSQSLPLVLLATLLVVVSVYTATRSSSFATSVNTGFLLTNAVPLVLLAAAQASVLLVGSIDLSVGSQVGLTTVLASYWLVDGVSATMTIVALAGIVAIAALVGLVNWFLIRRCHISPVIATVAMLAVLSGIALSLRETAGGRLRRDYSRGINTPVGSLPLAFFVVVVVMAGAELWLRRTGRGLAVRAVGFRPTSAHRLGIRIDRCHLAAHVRAAVLAALAGLFLVAQIGVGDATIGDNLALRSIAAAVLGGAALSGGRGSYVGCILGGVFVALTTNIIPFLELPSAFAYLAAGGLTLLAILVYSGGENWQTVREWFARLTARS